MEREDGTTCCDMCLDGNAIIEYEEDFFLCLWCLLEGNVTNSNRMIRTARQLTLERVPE